MEKKKRHQSNDNKDIKEVKDKSKKQDNSDIVPQRKTRSKKNSSPEDIKDKGKKEKVSTPKVAQVSTPRNKKSQNLPKKTSSSSSSSDSDSDSESSLDSSEKVTKKIPITKKLQAFSRGKSKKT